MQSTLQDNKNMNQRVWNRAGERGGGADALTAMKEVAKRMWCCSPWAPLIPGTDRSKAAPTSTAGSLGLGGGSVILGLRDLYDLTHSPYVHEKELHI